MLWSMQIPWYASWICKNIRGVLVLLPENPNNSNYTSCQRFLREDGKTCKLYIFQHLFRLNYVGHDKVDVSLNTQEICSKVSNLCQVYTLGRQNHTDTPEVLFNKFNQLSVGLPDDAKEWSIQLNSTFLSALSRKAVEDMATDKAFCMTDLTMLNTKVLQLEALRTVRTEASKSYKICQSRKPWCLNCFRACIPLMFVDLIFLRFG